MSQDARKLGGTPESPVRVDLPCAWYGKHIQDQTDWIWRIEPAHVEELDAALQKSKEKDSPNRKSQRRTLSSMHSAPNSTAWCMSLSTAAASS